MRYLTLLSLSSAIGVALARNCQNLTVTVSIEGRNGVFNVTATESNIEVVNFVLDQVQQGHNGTAEVLEGYANVEGTYTLSSTYCTPDSGPGKALQILTHGVGFDRSYWDASLNDYNYSYVNRAVEAGYSTFFYDRLGIGESSRADPIQDIQSGLEIASLAALTKLLRSGSVPGVQQPYSKVIHVGHSYGSIQTYALVRDYPELSDAIILTGFSQNGSFIADFELGGNFVAVQNSPLASQYPAGYLAAGSKSGVQSNFFAPGDFGPEALDYAYTTGQPVSQGELLTQGGAAAGVNEFAGPVLIITGERDVPFCGGDCDLTGNPNLPDIPSSSKESFPKASEFDVVIVPGAGHGLNLQ
jgi:pimeloyl-ACP methyl ester carboxylesterase